MGSSEYSGLAEKEDILAQFTPGLRELLYDIVWQWIFSLHDIALQRNFEFPVKKLSYLVISAGIVGGRGAKEISSAENEVEWPVLSIDTFDLGEEVAQCSHS
ncbi:hypothetical protein PLEOSDRAFT_1069455 [Pleurotus ostreatus PC15]|uniref:Uncharacterized protein n=1 Tax=Pleurotus ostreatus (strain PC15) TaxID=1137138 RepID=A0A067NZ84_PLEO1|nr:hypothetical protein PLEOSDRAFT_1069455 [Pleurotus ostreatus PC15]